MYSSVAPESDAEGGENTRAAPLAPGNAAEARQLKAESPEHSGTFLRLACGMLAGCTFATVLYVAFGRSHADAAPLNVRYSPLAPAENLHDGNVCDDSEEYFHGLCYRACASLTHGTHPYRVSAFTCCATSPCGLNIMQMKSASLLRCRGYDVSSNDGGKACPHQAGVCLENEEQFRQQCFEKCSVLTDGAFPHRFGVDTCCDARGTSCWKPKHRMKNKDFDVGGGGLDNDPLTPASVHAPLNFLAEAGVAVTSDTPTEVTIDELPVKFVKVLKVLYGDLPPGSFLRGRHGITHFHLEGPADASRGLAVLSHGIGTNMDAYQPAVREALLAEGYRVLRYSFLGHGWSYAGPSIVPPAGLLKPAMARYTKEVFLQQARELADHVLGHAAPISLWVGHSTGGVVGVLAAEPTEGIGRPIRQLALISPAFWAVKPMLVRALDHVPRLASEMVTSVPELHASVAQEYLANCDNAFAHAGDTYFYPTQYHQAKKDIKRMFELHPQIVEAIVGVNLFFLTGDLIAKDRVVLQNLEQGSKAPQTCLLWGTRDIVVPFEHAHEIVEWNSRAKLVELTDMGHESPKEDPNRIAQGLQTCVASFGETAGSR